MDKYIKICAEDDLDAILDLKLANTYKANLASKNVLENPVIETIIEDSENVSDTEQERFSELYVMKNSPKLSLLQNHILPTFLWDIPDSVSLLFERFRSNLSDFSFVYAISAQMCQEIMPMECYVEFKMGLLLSLASIQTENGSMPLPIVGIGSDTSFANLLMMQSAELADRFVSSVDKFHLSVLKHNSIVEANPLLLAKGGVYFLGDWLRLKDGAQNKIVKDISLGYVNADGITTNYSVHAAIWCYWKNYKNNMKDIKTFGTLSKVFGIPFILEEKCVEKFTNFLLEHAISPSQLPVKDDLSISFDDMKQYIRIVSKITVKMPTDCADMLKNYFIASRSERPQCLTERSYLALHQISESFAKLSFRNYVTISDVAGAIYLSEHFIRNVYGPGIIPPPIMTICNELEHFDNFFCEFLKWLSVYLSRFSFKANGFNFE